MIVVIQEDPVQILQVLQVSSTPAEPGPGVSLPAWKWTSEDLAGLAVLSLVVRTRPAAPGPSGWIVLTRGGGVVVVVVVLSPDMVPYRDGFI